MAEDKASGQNGKFKLDFETLGLEIDKEIDNLFVPADERRRPPDHLKAESAGPAESHPRTFAADMPGFDRHVFQDEIDRQIDTLFQPQSIEQPAASASKDQTTPATPPPAGTVHGLEKPDAASAAGKLPYDQDFQNEIDRQIDMLFQPQGTERPAASASKEKTAPATPPPAGTVHGLERPDAASAANDSPIHRFTDSPLQASPNYISRAELPKYVEALNAAYLSLDWDFSQENIRKLQSALSDLEPYASSVPGSISIFKILKSILPRLKEKPQSANNRIVGIIRESQGLLAHMFLMEGPPGPSEKERLHALVSRFNQLREKALAAKEAKAREARKQQIAITAAASHSTITLASSLNEQYGTRTEEAMEPLAQPASSLPDHQPARAPWSEASSARMPDRWSLVELKDWMDSSGQLFREAIDGLDSEIERIRQLEKIFGKNATLVPIMLKLAGIRAGMTRRVDSLRDQKEEWQKRISWIENLERISALHEREQEKAQEPPPAAFSTAPADLEADRTESRREDVYVFHFSKRPYGLLASQVVRFCRLSRSKINLILKRGFGTLTDAKPVFRGIRSGILGQWADAPAKVLRDLKFNIVDARIFEATDLPSDPRMAVFISNGKGNGIILADSEDVRLYEGVEIVPGNCSCHSAVGYMKTESDICAEVLDIDRVFLQSI